MFCGLPNPFMSIKPKVKFLVVKGEIYYCNISPQGLFTITQRLFSVTITPKPIHYFYRKAVFQVHENVVILLSVCLNCDY